MKNNLVSVWTSVYTFLSTYPIAGMERYQKQVSDFLTLGEEAMVAQVKSNGFVHHEIRRENAVANFSIELKMDYDTATHDEEGNRWYRYFPQVKVSWPGHGSDTLDIIEERITLYDEVRRMMQDLENIIKAAGEIWCMTSTKAELEAREEQHKRYQTINALSKACHSQTSGMKVGSKKAFFTPEGSPSLVLGVEHFQESRKLGRTLSYSARVESPISFSITRTA